MPTTLGVPVKLLYECEGHKVTVELVNGELYRGILVDAEDSMNIQMQQVVSAHNQADAQARVKEGAGSGTGGRRGSTPCACLAAARQPAAAVESLLTARSSCCSAAALLHFLCCATLVLCSLLVRTRRLQLVSSRI